MEGSPFVHRDDYLQQHREDRAEKDQLWTAIRKEIPDAIAAAEERIVEELVRVDTRINGRIKKNANDIADLQSAVWLSQLFTRLSKHPLMVSAASTALGALVALIATH